MHRPTVSFCIPTRNRAEFLAQHLEHLANFKLFDFEVVVSDNCSSDNTEAVVQSMQSRFNSLIYVRQNESLNFYETQIAAAQLAYGKYMMVVADDDLTAENGIAKAISILDDDETVAAVYGGWEAEEAGTRLPMPEHLVKHGQVRLEPSELITLMINCHTPEMPIVRTEIFHKSHLSKMSHYGFDFYGASLFAQFGAIVLMPDVTMKVTLHEEQVSMRNFSSDIIEAHTADWEMFLSHFDDLPPKTKNQLQQRLAGLQYWTAAAMAMRKGKLVRAREMLIRAIGCGYSDAKDQLLLFENNYLFKIITDSLESLFNMTGKTDRVLIERCGKTAPLANQIRESFPQLSVVEFTSEDLGHLGINNLDFIIYSELETLVSLEEVSLIPLRRIRRIDDLIEAVQSPKFSLAGSKIVATDPLRPAA